MTKKHFEAIAKILRKWGEGRMEPNKWIALVNDFADLCQAENPNFDRDRFKRACTFEKLAD